MKKLSAALFAFTFSIAVAPQAVASLIVTDTLYSIGWGVKGSAIVGTDGSAFPHCTNPDCTASPAAGQFEFDIAVGSTGILHIQDLFDSTERFSVWANHDSGISIKLDPSGATSVPTAGGTCGSDFYCAVADIRYSRGIYDLESGHWKLNFNLFSGQTGSGALIIRQVPEPQIIALFGLGLLGLGFARRRKVQS